MTVYHAKEHEKESERRLGLQKQEYESTIKRHLSFIDQVCLFIHLSVCLSICPCLRVRVCVCVLVCVHAYVRACVCVFRQYIIISPTAY